jgi:hypothetical protein
LTVDAAIAAFRTIMRVFPAEENRRHRAAPHPSFPKPDGRIALI